jgi:hypothetical protein
MPGIFLSHSSRDKPLVRRIAAELVLERLPVWLDQWEMAVGDSLDRTLAGALQSADYIALCISKSSVESGWVERELDMALTHERRLGRVFVPIRIDETEVPLRVADRIYADFAKSVTGGVRQLVARVRADGRDRGQLDPSRVMVPILMLADAITINTNRLSQYLSWLASTHVDQPGFSPRVFVVGHAWSSLVNQCTATAGQFAMVPTVASSAQSISSRVSFGTGLARRLGEVGHNPLIGTSMGGALDLVRGRVQSGCITRREPLNSIFQLR